MSPTRRDFLAILAGAALAPAAASAAPPARMDRETLIAARDLLATIEQTGDADALAISAANLCTDMLDSTIMTLCPHGKETWQLEMIDPREPAYAWFRCEACDAIKEVRHLDGRPA